MGRSNRDQNGKVFQAPRPSWTVLVVKGWICRCKEAILTGSRSVPGAVCRGRRKFIVMVQDTDFGLARLPARQASGRFPRGRHFLMFIVCVTVLLGRSNASPRPSSCRRLGTDLGKAARWVGTLVFPILQLSQLRRREQFPRGHEAGKLGGERRRSESAHLWLSLLTLLLFNLIRKKRPRILGGIYSRAD